MISTTHPETCALFVQDRLLSGRTDQFNSIESLNELNGLLGSDRDAKLQATGNLVDIHAH